VTKRVSVRVDRDARVGRRCQWATDSEQLRCDATHDNHTATTLSFFWIRVKRGDHLFKYNCGNFPVQSSLRFPSHRDNMSNPSTPPRSRNTSDGRFSSKPTPLKHDRLGSQAHSSGPLPKASTLYMEMTREACDKFVGPMPVNEFLSEFIPTTTKKRPSKNIKFSHSSISGKEKAFVCHRIPNVIDAHEYYRSM